METGKIARWEPERGFGFIKQDNGKPDIFVHVSAFGRTVSSYDVIEDSRVQYLEVSSDKGPKAIQVSFTGTPSVPEPQDYEDSQDYPEEDAVMPTEKAWRELWDRASEAAFEALMDGARANGWVR